ncbi:MAG: hypothetical protein HC765_16140, partial [Brachymonas sp.]|nr:hypothetical protein [Brachymonas sp.]
MGGVYDYNARFFNPLTAKFLSADSIVQSPFDSQSLNRYAYARLNPFKYIDPTGHDIAIVQGSGPDVRDAPGDGGGTGDVSSVIAAYKGWTIKDSQAWLRKWNAASASDREAMERADGIRLISYSSR